MPAFRASPVLLKTRTTKPAVMLFKQLPAQALSVPKVVSVMGLPAISAPLPARLAQEVLQTTA